MVARRRRAALACAVALLLCAALPSAAAARDDGISALRPLVRRGEKAPPFSLKDIDGKVSAFLPGGGKPALIVFFSAFCPLCRELAPSVKEIAGRRGGPVRVIAVNLDGKRFTNAVRSFIKEYDFDFPVLLDDIRDDFFIASDPYGVEKTPTAVLVDGDGSVKGAWPAEAMRDLVRDFDRIAAGLKKGKSAKK